VLCEGGGKCEKEDHSLDVMVIILLPWQAQVKGHQVPVFILWDCSILGKSLEDAREDLRRNGRRRQSRDLTETPGAAPVPYQACFWGISHVTLQPQER
jgi:hypothetical protein